MKVLIVGGGGREHALAWKIRQSPLVKELYCAPGNPGIGRNATCVPIDAASIIELADFARSLHIDLTVVGPELPLTLGIADEFEKRGLTIFGATAEAAMIESSKVFAKEFMARHDIPTAASEVFTSAEEAKEYLRGDGAEYPLVIKADGLAAGKGVVVCPDREQALEAVLGMMEDRIHGNAGDRILIEEFLEGREVSFFVLSDGARILPLVTCQDYKRAFDGDVGPNTGGMGAYSPSAFVDQDLFREVRDRIMAPVIAGLAHEGRNYRGILYAGLMLTADGPYVLEFNARLGDPEAQAMIPRIGSDLVPLLADAAAGRLEPEERIEWRQGSAATVVLASSGYPGSHSRGMPIQGLGEAERLDDVIVFQAGTASGSGTDPLVAGGRVVSVTGVGRDLPSAVANAYDGVSRIRFEGMHYRTDIGRDAIRTLTTNLEPSP